MSTIKRFEDIEAWKSARQLCEKIGSIIDSGVFKNNFRLINQVDSSSGSIMDNIAEGFERSGNSEFKNFLVMAKGSNGEFRSQLYRCFDRKHITKEKFDELYEKNCTLGSKIMSFITYLKNTELKGQRYKT